MDEHIRIFEPGSKEYEALQAFAGKVNAMGGNVELRVETTYFDFGQDWKWTTLIAHRRDMEPGSVLSSWQALTPKEQSYVINGDEAQLALLAEKLADCGH